MLTPKELDVIGLEISEVGKIIEKFERIYRGEPKDLLSRAREILRQDRKMALSEIINEFLDEIITELSLEFKRIPSI